MFGLGILTQNGLENLADILSLRVVHSFTTSQSSGTYVAPGSWSASRDTFFVVSSSGYRLPKISRSGNTFSWSAFYSGNSVSFTFFLIAVNNPNAIGSWGLVAKNESGGIALDQNYPALAIKKSGQSSGSVAAPGYPSYLHNIACLPSEIVSVSLDSGQYMANGPYQNGYRQIFHSESSFEYRILTNDISSLTSASDYGLQLFSASGLLIYDSGIPIISIKSVINDTPSGGLSVSGMSSSDRFIACTSPFWLWSSDLHPMLGIYMGSEMYYGVERNGSSLSLKSVNGVSVQSGRTPIYGPVPNGAEMSVLVGKG